MNPPIYEELWDCRFGASRTDSDWIRLLEHVTGSFSRFIGHPVKPDAPEIDDVAGAAHCCIGAPVTIPLVERIGMCYSGGIDISVNRGGSTSIRAILLLFCNNKRMAVHPKRASMIEDWFWFDLDREDTSTSQWLLRECIDECGEWERYMSFSDWRPPA